MKRLGVLFGNRTELWWDHPVMQSFAWKKGRVADSGECLSAEFGDGN